MAAVLVGCGAACGADGSTGLGSGWAVTVMASRLASAGARHAAQRRAGGYLVSNWTSVPTCSQKEHCWLVGLGSVALRRSLRLLISMAGVVVVDMTLPFRKIF
jgi:hypothetical protein